MDKKKVLFVCIHNSARSQMAEAFVNAMASSSFEAESAGIELGTLNPFVVEAMKDIGIDISSHETKSVQKLIDEQRSYDYIITVCDEASAERCPVFPDGGAERIHIGFEDPSALEGSDADRLQKTIEIRDQIKNKVQSWVRGQQNV